jgi:hypothetical protein
MGRATHLLALAGPLASAELERVLSSNGPGRVAAPRRSARRPAPALSDALARRRKELQA